jgi:hypothetical protein
VVPNYAFTLPSGNKIEFREPRNRDRQKVLSILKPEDNVSVDEVLAAECLVSINGVAMEKEPDPRRRMSIWTIKDSQAFVYLFLQMFTVGEDDRKALEGNARKLLGLDEPESGYVQPTESATAVVSASEPEQS